MTHIRAYVPTDLDRLQQIRAAAFAPIFRSFRAIVGDGMAEPLFGGADTEQGQYLADVLQSAPDGRAFVAEVGDQVVGFIHLEMDAERAVGVIGLNAVDPAFVGRGIGTSMYRFALDRFRAEGMKVVKVSTGADPSHEPARRAYAQAGFGRPVPGLTLFQALEAGDG